MALLPEAFVLGTTSPALPVSRLASKRGRTSRKVPQQGKPSALASASAVLAAVALAKRRQVQTRSTVVAVRVADPSSDFGLKMTIAVASKRWLMRWDLSRARMTQNLLKDRAGSFGEFGFKLVADLHKVTVGGGARYNDGKFNWQTTLKGGKEVKCPGPEADWSYKGTIEQT
ncbi:cryS [Symbiodinium sp. CCMP2592]|nr:cryS [Symbiodinium sp. CCMP2592]